MRAAAARALFELLRGEASRPTVTGHADCVAYMKSFGIPMLVLGGGGYTLRNVPRVWTYETAVLLGTDIKDALPYNDYFEYYGPDYRLHMPVSNMENLNSREYLENQKVQLFDILSQVEPAPGVQIQTGASSEAPPPEVPQVEEDEDSKNPDVRPGAARRDARGRSPMICAALIISPCLCCVPQGRTGRSTRQSSSLRTTARRWRHETRYRRPHFARHERRDGRRARVPDYQVERQRRLSRKRPPVVACLV